MKSAFYGIHIQYPISCLLTFLSICILLYLITFILTCLLTIYLQFIFLHQITFMLTYSRLLISLFSYLLADRTIYLHYFSFACVLLYFPALTYFWTDYKSVIYISKVQLSNGTVIFLVSFLWTHTSINSLSYILQMYRVSLVSEWQIMIISMFFSLWCDAIPIEKISHSRIP